MVVAGAVTYKFTVDEYHRMAEAGVFHEDDRIELVEGEIIRIAAIGNRHFATVNRLTTLFAGLASERKAIVSVQNPVQLNERSEPEPDLVLFRYSPDYYEGRSADISDVLLIVEVADSSVDYDRLTKVALYARSSIAEVWLVDLTRNLIEVYRSPVGDGYSDQHICLPGSVISPLAFPETEIRAAEVLGRQS